MKITNIGCIEPQGLTVTLDSILRLVGTNNTAKSTVLRAYELARGKASFSEGDLCMRALVLLIRMLRHFKQVGFGLYVNGQRTTDQ